MKGGTHQRLVHPHVMVAHCAKEFNPTSFTPLADLTNVQHLVSEALGESWEKHRGAAKPLTESIVKTQTAFDLNRRANYNCHVQCHVPRPTGLRSRRFDPVDSNWSERPSETWELRICSERNVSVPLTPFGNDAPIPSARGARPGPGNPCVPFIHSSNAAMHLNEVSRATRADSCRGR